MATKPRKAAPALPALSAAQKARIKATGAALARAQGIIEAKMREASRAPGVGSVRLTLASSGGFYAHAMPDRAAVSDAARAALVARALADGAGSVGIADVNDALERAADRPLAVGSGATALEAVMALLLALQIRRDGA